MNLKKFMLYNIIISIIFLLYIFIISNIYNKYLNVDIKKFLLYNKLKKESVKVVSLGTSHTKLGIYFENNLENINLAKDSQSFYYDLKLLEKYNKKIAKNGKIIIPISIQSFYNAENKEIDMNYINILNRIEIKNIKFNEYFLKKYFSILFPPSKIFDFIYFKKENFKSLVYYPKDLTKRVREKESEETVNIHLGIEKNTLRDYSQKNAEQDFINLTNYIEKQNWELILITTPFSYLYNQNIIKEQPQAFQERIYDNIKNVEKKLKKEFIYLDYSHDERFQNNLEYFYDDDHLNKKGAKYFTEILLKDIKKLEN